MSNIKVLDKTFQILNSFDDANKSISLKDLTIITKLNKSTILRICNSLIKYNFLIKNEINGSYRLGPGSWKLGSIYNSNFRSGEEIREILGKICAVTGQSAGYWVKAGTKKVCLYRVNSKSELNHYVVEGTTFELKSATGKVLSAFTGGNDDLKNAIEKKGYIYTKGERLDNIASVAIPIFDMAFVICSRLLKKVSPFYPDNNHIHHRLIKAGFSHKKVVKICILCNILVCTMSLFLFI